jgi:hypothetical protein
MQFNCKIRTVFAFPGAWGSTAVSAPRCVGRSRDRSQWCRLEFFPKLPTEPCALGSTHPLKMSTRKTPGGEGGRCVRLTTLPPSYCWKSRKSGALTYRIPKSLLRPVAGKLYLYHLFAFSTKKKRKSRLTARLPDTPLGSPADSNQSKHDHHFGHSL